MHSYTEYSPSGNGLHILFRANCFQYDTKRFYIMNHQAGIEVYVAGTTNKYVTVTGKVCEQYDFGDRTKELQILLERFMVRPETNAANAINAGNSSMDTTQLLSMAKSSKNGVAFTSLWDAPQWDTLPSPKQIWHYAVTWHSGQEKMRQKWIPCSANPA